MEARRLDLHELRVGLGFCSGIDNLLFYYIASHLNQNLLAPLEASYMPLIATGETFVNSRENNGEAKYLTGFAAAKSSSTPRCFGRLGTEIGIPYLS